MDHQGFLRRPWDEDALGRRNARGVKLPFANVGDLTRLPVIPTAIFGSHHIVKHRAQLLPVDPQEDLGLG